MSKSQNSTPTAKKNPYAELIEEGKGKGQELEVETKISLTHALTFSQKLRRKVRDAQFSALANQYVEAEKESQFDISADISKFILQFSEDLDLDKEIIPGKNILSLAIENGDKRLFYDLIYDNFDINQAVGENLDSPLHIAIRAQQYEMSYRLTLMSKIKMGVLNAEGVSPLMLLNETAAPLDASTPTAALQTLQSLERHFKNWCSQYVNGKSLFYVDALQEDKDELAAVKKLSGPELLETSMHQYFIESLLRENPTITEEPAPTISNARTTKKIATHQLH